MKCICLCYFPIWMNSCHTKYGLTHYDVFNILDNITRQCPTFELCLMNVNLQKLATKISFMSGPVSLGSAFSGEL